MQTQTATPKTQTAAPKTRTLSPAADQRAARAAFRRHGGKVRDFDFDADELPSAYRFSRDEALALLGR